MLHLAFEPRRSVIAYAATAISASICVAIVPILIMRTIDAILRGTTSYTWSIGLLVVGLLGAGLTRASGLQAVHLSTDLLVRMRHRAYICLQDQPFLFHVAVPQGAQLNRLFDDTNNAVGAIWNGLAPAMFNLVTLLAVGCTMLLLDPTLALVCAAFAAVSFVMTRPLVAQARPAALQQAKAFQALHSFTAEHSSLAAYTLLRTSGALESASRGFESRAQDLRAANNRSSAIPIETSSRASFAVALAIPAIFLAAAELSASPDRAVGTAVAFTTFLQRMLAPATALNGFRGTWRAGYVAFERVADVIRVMPAPPPPAPRRGSRGTASRVRLIDVSFKYPRPYVPGMKTFNSPVVPVRSADHSAQNDRTLQSITFECRPGSTTAIVGRSGAGKTTIINLILGLLEPDLGRVEISNEDGSDPVVAYVSQETFLFNATLESNLRIAAPEASDSELAEAIASAQLVEVVERLPSGLDTIIGERGYSLSGGERQRIAIARALLRNPSLIILDEATAHLDAETERALQAAIARVTHGRTVVVVAHRVSTIRTADRIIVLEDGRVAETGTPAELEADYSSRYVDMFGPKVTLDGDTRDRPRDGSWQ